MEKNKRNMYEETSSRSILLKPRLSLVSFLIFPGISEGNLPSMANMFNGSYSLAVIYKLIDKEDGLIFGAGI